MLTEPTTELERQGFHLHYFSMLDSMGCIVDWLSRAIANASDYTACIVADRRSEICLCNLCTIVVCFSESGVIAQPSWYDFRYTKALAAPRIQVRLCALRMHFMARRP